MAGLIFSIIILIGMITIIVTKPKPGIDSSMTQPEQMTLSGTYLCLPHTNTDGPQTMECAFGIKIDSGEYYAIDFSLMSGTPPAISLGEHITGTGIVIPLETLDSDQWQKYPIKGIFAVTDSVEISKVSNNSIIGTKWIWLRTEHMDKTITKAPAGEKFVLSFDTEKQISSTTDCNSLRGTMIMDGEVISFGSFISTKMYCEGSLEASYSKDLGYASSYVIKGDELRINLNRDIGTMIFTRK